MATNTKNESIDLKLGVVLDVSDVDRAKSFYEQLGWVSATSATANVETRC